MSLLNSGNAFRCADEVHQLDVLYAAALEAVDGSDSGTAGSQHRVEQQYVAILDEGFVNIPLSIKGVIFSCFLREDTEKPMIKISLRSVGTFPCNQLAAEFFGGGGHLNASGGEFYGTMDEARKVFEQALEKYKPLLNAKG